MHNTSHAFEQFTFTVSDAHSTHTTGSGLAFHWINDPAIEIVTCMQLQRLLLKHLLPEPMVIILKYFWTGLDVKYDAQSGQSWPCWPQTAISSELHVHVLSEIVATLASIFLTLKCYSTDYCLSSCSSTIHSSYAIHFSQLNCSFRMVNNNLCVFDSASCRSLFLGTRRQVSIWIFWN